MVWRYRGSAARPFYTGIQGKQEVLPNGDVLVTGSGSGRVFEVARTAQPSIVWEYCNRLPERDGEGRIGVVTLAERVARDMLDFLN